MLDALAHAHGRGIVHRDVKPSNVLLGEGDAIDVRLLDFGLAQMDEFDTLTAIGDVPGTLTYVSPERLAGEVATPAADVWAVGVMLWEALAGRHPFRASDAAGTSRRIKAGAPPLESVRPDLPAALCETVARAPRPRPGQAPGGGAARDRAPRRARQAPPAAGAGRAARARHRTGRAASPGSPARGSRRRSPPRPGRAGWRRCCPSIRRAGRSG